MLTPSIGHLPEISGHFKSYLKEFFSKHLKTNKTIHLAGDFNLNVIDYETVTKVKNFFNLIFEHGLVPVINKPTRVTKKSTTAVDHIITNSFLNNDIKTGIIKTDISDHFPIFIISNKPDTDIYPTNNFIFKRYINDETINNFKSKLNEIN